MSDDGQQNTGQDGQNGQPQDQSGQGGQPGQSQGGQPQSGQPQNQSGQAQGGQPAQSQGGQPGQPQGGQPGQPQGGQPGQPQGGQPTGGQPGQPAGQQGYAEPGLADKLQQPAVISQLKSTVGLYALLGVGFLLFAGIAGAATDPTSVGFGFSAVAVGIGIGPFVAVTATRGTFTELDIEDNVRYVSTFIGNAGGYLALSVLTLVGGAIGYEADVFGDFLLSIVLGVFVVGAIGVLTVFYEQLF